ncbi:MAG: CHAT domain-containing protein, partial [Chloroflexi bacterium]|nr:CHAT domain-containing protein [Chloroflexota bacterium]
NIGKTWLELGDLTQAKENLLQAATTYRQSNALFPAARSLAHLALAEARQEHFAQALTYLTEGREICEAQNARGYIAVCEQIRGEILRRQDDLPQALDATLNAEKLFGELKMMLNALSCQIQIADLHRLIGNDSRAAEMYSQSLKLTQSALPDLAWRCAAGLAHLAEARGDLQTALEHYRQAIGYMSESRRWLTHESLVDTFLSSRGEEINRALHLALRLNDSQTALTLIETHRAQLLANHIRSERITAPPDPKLESLRGRMTELRWRLRLDLNESFIRPPTPEHQAALDELDRLGKDYRRRTALSASISESNLPDALNLAPLQRLGKWSCLLYHWLDSKLLIAAITESETTLHICDLSPLDHLALDLCSSLQPDRRRMLFAQNTVMRSHLRRLDSILLPDPLRAKLKPDETLILIPSGSLHHLPFHALHDGERYLCERATLVHADSLTSLSFLLNRIENNNAPPQSAVVIGVENFGGRLPPLPHAKIEAQAIHKVFAKTTGIEEEAASATVKKLIESESPDVIHFATHAVIESQYGELSRLAFHHDDLHADEIATLRLRARLITLSACHSSLGQLHRGEENIGLRQAFFTAGAAAILSTLWAIEDDSAPDFMENFYCALTKENLSPSAALAHAQRKWIADGKPLREWGGYVLHGVP